MVKRRIKRRKGEAKEGRRSEEEGIKSKGAEER